MAYGRAHISDRADKLVRRLFQKSADFVPSETSEKTNQDVSKVVDDFRSRIAKQHERVLKLKDGRF